MKLPPILQTPGLRLIEIGNNEKGAYLKFAVDENDVREVTVYMQAVGPVKWMYEYSIWDEATRTVSSYKGRRGDPTRDRRTEIRAIE